MRFIDVCVRKKKFFFAVCASSQYLWHMQARVNEDVQIYIREFFLSSARRSKRDALDMYTNAMAYGVCEWEPEL